MAWLGGLWLPAMPLGTRLVLALVLVTLGIVGDLLESVLKRAAQVKDSSQVIPGHGGVLDRIDALLLVIPVYYVALRVASQGRVVKRIAILGSTGSIGTSALAVIDAYPDRLRVVGAGRGTQRRCALRRRFSATGRRLPPSATPRRSSRWRGARRPGHAVVGGADGLIDVATHPDVDILLCASSGTTALEAVLAAIDAGKTIALANKEVLVMAGELVTSAARARGVALLPVDSEHNAIHQCLHGRGAGEVRKLVLTASGGPFRAWPAERLLTARPEDALRHPTWQMGRKITIDSATLMNKGLEVIEAHWLFDVPASRIEVVVHPQSIVHSMVELTDGSTIAQLGVTDMRLPIQYAFSYPDRWGALLPPLDLTTVRRARVRAHRTRPGSRVCGWPTTRSSPAGPCQWRSMRPTKSPWTRFWRDGCRFPPLLRSSNGRCRHTMCNGPTRWPASAKRIAGRASIPGH